MKQAFLYTLKVWLTVIIAGPVPLLFLQQHTSWAASHYLTEYYWSVIGELVAFSPLMLLFFLLTLLVNRSVTVSAYKKPMIFLITEVLLLSFIYFVNYFFIKLPGADMYQVVGILIFTGIICGGVFLYRLTPAGVKN